MLWAQAVWAQESVPSEGPQSPPSIAVARFAHDERPGAQSAAPEPDVATLLAGRLSERMSTGVVAPAAFDVPSVEAPEARQVREWAERAGVGTVVLGSIRAAEGGVSVEVEVRSGHSGVAIANHQVALVAADDPAPAVDALAEAILTGLGYQPPAEPVEPITAAGAEQPSPKNERLSLIQEGEAISIQSDELEVIQDGAERHLIFSRGVRVEQGEVQLRTDRLDAYYKKGESQPDRLVARGQVRLKHGERWARCEVATFYNSERRVVCSGQASLQQGCDLVRGEEIHIDLQEDRVRVIGGASVVIADDGKTDCAGELL